MRTKINYFGPGGKFESALFELTQKEWNIINHMLNREEPSEAFTGTMILDKNEIQIVSAIASYEWPIPENYISIDQCMMQYMLPHLIKPNTENDEGKTYSV